MQHRLTRLGLALALSAPLTLADFRYEQSSRMTGGSMMSMMKMAAKFSKGAMDPVRSTVAVKGNRLVMNHGKSATIYDLDKETVTDVNFERHEYSVTTFAEMKAFFEKNMKAMKSGPGANATIEIDVNETGKTETIAGLQAREFLMTMKLEAANPQTGKTSEMRMEMSNWLAPKVAGYEEIGEFYQRMGQKMDMGAIFGGPAAGGMGKAMAEAAKKMAAMDGVPVLQIVRMSPTDPEQMKQMEQMQAAQAAQQSHQGPSAGQVAEQAAEQQAASAVAGRLGRFGGLGSAGVGGLGGLRKKRAEAPPAAAPEPAVAAAPEAGVKGSFTSEASLMETTVESSNFSNKGVEDALFAVPGEFKLVKGAMQR